MYALYAEDTKSGEVRKLLNLTSTRFSRAMKQARQEPPMHGCRMFVMEDVPLDSKEMDTAWPAREYLDTRSVEQVNRATLQSQVSAPKTGVVDWGSKNKAGETLNDVYVDIIRRQASRS